MRAGKKQRKAPGPGPHEKVENWAWLPRAEWGLAILLAGVALFFHFTFFTHAGALWRDEVHSVQMASLPSISSTVESLRYDSFPLLSTLVLRGWIHAGMGSDQGLRVFGLLVGALLLGALWLTCRFLGCPTPLFSLALVGLNPWMVRTADSIRPYGLGIALVVLTLGCVWKAVETPSRKWFLLAGLLAVLSVQCMYQSAFLILAICLGGVVVSLRDSRVKTAIGVVLVGLAAAVSLIPYLSIIAAAQSWGILVRAPITMRHLFEVFFQALGSGSVATLWLWFGLAALSVAVGIRGLLSRRKQHAARARSNLALLCATVLVAAVAVYLAAMKGTQLLTQPWYYVPLAVMVAPTLDAAAWLAATTARLRIARLVIVAAIASTVAIPAWRQLHNRWTNLDFVAAKIGKEATAGDIVVLNPFWLGITFQRYYKGPAELVTIPPMEDTHIVRFDLVKAAMTRPNPLEPALEAIAKTLQSGHRVYWIAGVAVTGNGVPPAVPPAPLPGSGWYLGPYLFGWARQATYQVESHGTQADPMDTSAGGPVLPYENVTVTVVSGWH